MTTVSGVYIINLDKRHDRLQRLVKQIRRSDIGHVPIYRFAAHDSTKEDYSSLLSAQAKAELDKLKQTGVRSFHAQLSPGAIGCFLSHYDVWKSIATSIAHDADMFLVLEDDATIPENVNELMKEGFAALAASGLQPSMFMPFLLLWEVLCIKGCATVPNSKLMTPEVFWSTQAYCINAHTARLLMTYPLFPIENQIDTELQNLRAAGVLNVYAYPVLPNVSTDTDIQITTTHDAPYWRPGNPPTSSRYDVSAKVLTSMLTQMGLDPVKTMHASKTVLFPDAELLVEEDETVYDSRPSRSVDVGMGFLWTFIVIVFIILIVSSLSGEV